MIFFFSIDFTKSKYIEIHISIYTLYVCVCIDTNQNKIKSHITDTV